jgi:hypothetical protein
MKHTPIPSRSKARRWIAHGDPIPGVTLTPWPPRDHDDVKRFGGGFVRILYLAERFDDLLRFPEHPMAVVRPTCDPRTIRRSYCAIHAAKTPWPDPLDADPADDFRRPISARLLAESRRL